MKIASLQTKHGILEVERSGYSIEGYPGFIVSLKNDGKELACVLFEVDEENSECKVHVWDTTQDEPVCDMHGTITQTLELENY